MADPVLYAPAPWDERPLTAVELQRLDGWILMLDVDLALAQRVLRGPTRKLPLPPIALPAYVNREGRVLAPAIEAPDEKEAAASSSPPAPPAGLRGAYARRARKS